MSRDPQRLPDYLGHILEAIERIHAYVADVDEVGFLSSKIVQDAVIRNLEVIGEASRNIESVHPEFAAAHPATSRWTWKSSGRRFRATCLTYTRKSPR